MTERTLGRPRSQEEQFIIETIEKLESQLGGLKEPIPWFIAHGRKRSRRQMREVQGQRKEQIDEVERALQALRDDGNIEITFIRDKDGTISGFKI